MVGTIGCSNMPLLARERRHFLVSRKFLLTPNYSGWIPARDKSTADFALDSNLRAFNLQPWLCHAKIVEDNENDFAVDGNRPLLPRRPHAIDVNVTTTTQEQVQIP
eukprot:scaffold41013_cov250-Skeletonema_dohrnii-CCMP3373.AAC.2